MTDVNQLKDALPGLSDDDLLGMLADIQSDPEAFQEHVGLNEAAEFLAALLFELSERKIEVEDSTLPKVFSEPPLRSALLRKFVSQQFRAAVTESLSKNEAPALQARPSTGQGNRKARRAQKSRNRRASKTL
jgi:hypothetical protein